MSFKIPIVTGGIDIASDTYNSEYYQKIKVSTEGEIKRPFSQFLTIDGIGTGNSSATGDYSSIVEFSMTPSASNQVRITEMRVIVSDSGSFSNDTYGMMNALTTGIQIGVTNDGDFVYDITASNFIKKNSDWALLGEVYSTEFDPGVEETYSVKINFQEYIPEGIRLDGAIGDAFVVKMSDSMTGLTDQRFLVKGYFEDLSNYVS